MPTKHHEAAGRGKIPSDCAFQRPILTAIGTDVNVPIDFPVKTGEGMVMLDGRQLAIVTAAFQPNVFRIAPQGKEIIRIDPDGRIFWNGREVESDNEFRAAMLDIHKHLYGANK